MSTQEGRDEGSCRRQMSVSIRQAAKLVGARQARYLLKHAGNERRVRNRQPRGTEAHYGGKHEQPQGCTRAGPEVQVPSTSLLATAGSYSFCMRSQTPRRPLPRPHKVRPLVPMHVERSIVPPVSIAFSCWRGSVRGTGLLLDRVWVMGMG